MRIAVRPGHPLLDNSTKFNKSQAVRLAATVGASWLYMTAHDSSDDIVSRSFLADGLPLPLPAVHCGSYFVALDLLASTDMLGVLPPALLRSCMALGHLVELILVEPLIPIQLALYTRSGSPPTAATMSAASAILAISKRMALTGDLRSTAPLKI